MAPAGHLGLGGAAGLRAALRRAWRGVGRGARGREGEVGELEGGEEGRFGAACTPWFVAAQKRAEVPRLAFSDLPVSSVENREPWYFSSPPRARTGGLATPQSFDWLWPVSARSAR